MDEDEEEDAEDPQELAPFEASKVCCQYTRFRSPYPTAVRYPGVGSVSAQWLHLLASRLHCTNILLHVKLLCYWKAAVSAYRELEDYGLFTMCLLFTTKLGSFKHLSA